MALVQPDVVARKYNHSGVSLSREFVRTSWHSDTGAESQLSHAAVAHCHTPRKDQEDKSIRIRRYDLHILPRWLSHSRVARAAHEGLGHFIVNVVLVAHFLTSSHRNGRS